ncbi:restriction endonuclease subunit S [Synechocystis sp. PCC 7509]|uniref:restriction endonuclease subunit S n=1 Tax=Synechocystis sp. PCC 7509 TaxID=927677 RepID=UPI0002AC72BC|nr:restriction endonuclease subunit S [Synechocystis sp. PCC 7509]
MSNQVREGYKQTEIGLIPEDWEVKQLKTALKTNPQYGINAAAVVCQGDLPTYIRITDISEDGYFKPENLASVRHSSANQYFLEEGDLVFARTGASVGKSYFYRSQDGRLVYAGFLIKVQPNKSVLLPSFLSQYVKTKAYWNWVLVMSMRSGQPGINGNEYSQLLLPFPKLEEQHAIAQALSDVDALISALDKLIAKKRDLKTAIMQQLLTGKKRLRGFDGEWKIKLFSEIAFYRKERLDPKKSNTQEFCVELEHIESSTGRLLGSTQTGEQSSLKAIFQPGDVLFGKLRSYLRKYWLADCKGVCSTEIWVLVANSQLTIPKFLYQIVTLDWFIEAASTAYGTHMPRADWNVVKNCEVAIPPLEEQRAIALVLSDMDKAISALESRQSKTQAIKQGMMQELLTGRTRLV